MSLRAITAALAAILLLTACGATAPPPSVAQTFIRDHTACTPVSYALPQWSQDGASIYYLVYSNPTTDVHVMTRYGKNDRLLGKVEDSLGPLMSPDHGLLLITRQNSQMFQGYDYYVLNLASGKLRLAATLAEAASWSPDGQWFVYATPRQGTALLQKANPTTGEILPLTSRPAGSDYLEVHPFWSPDGATIAYTTIGDRGHSSVTLIAPDGGGQRTLAIEHQANVCAASSRDRGDEVRGWLPDSRSLLVAHICDSHKTLAVVTLAGQEVADLSALGEDLYDQKWSPDGEQIAFTTVLGPAHPLQVAETGRPVIRTLQPDAANPAWSPDGVDIAFTGSDAAGMSEIFTIHPDGTGLTQITQNPGGGLCLH